MLVKAMGPATIVLLLVGCMDAVDESTPRDPSETAAKTDPAFDPDWIINFFTSFAVVTSQESDGEVLVEAGLRPLDRPERWFFLRIIDATGTRHDQEFELPEMKPLGRHTVKFQYPAAPRPLLVFAECTCAFAWLARLGEDPGVQPGDEEMVQYVRQNVTLSYDPTNAEDVTAKQPLRDGRGVAFNASIIHWTLWYGTQNFDGNVTLTRPNGRVDTYLERGSDGNLQGHLSDGYHPPDVGTWRADFNGTGYFRFKFDFYVLKEEAWAHYGITKPAQA